MAISQRPSARFFGAFYRWNLHIQSRRYCTPTTIRSRNIPPRSVSFKSYSRGLATTHVRGQHGGVLHKDNDESEHRSGQKHHEILPEESTGSQEDSKGGKVPETPPSPTALEEEIKQNALRDSLRSLMRHVPYPIVILTAASQDPETQDPVPLGIAVSSFNTVTLDPPTISFNIRHPSKTLDAIRANAGRFRIHFLRSSRKAASAADSFTRGNNKRTFNERQELVTMTTSGESGDLTTDTLLPAKLRGDIANAAFECELVQELTVADHVIAVAKINEIESHNSSHSVLTYVRGKYVNSENRPVLEHLKSTTAARPNEEEGSPAKHVLWSLPLFPTEGDREAFKTNVVNYISAKPHLLQLPMQDAQAGIISATKLPLGALGLSLPHLLARLQAEQNLLDPRDGRKLTESVFTQYYGRLSPTDISEIVQKARDLFAETPAQITRHYGVLYFMLGVSQYNTGMLASDILEPLRSDGLVLPFAPLARLEAVANPTLEYLERVEHRLREYLRAFKKPQGSLLIPTKELVEQISVPSYMGSYIRCVRARLLVEAHPQLFDSDQIDISGHITSAEARIVVSRIVASIYQDRFSMVFTKLSWWEILRQCKIHPMISGFDPVLFIDRLRYYHMNRPISKFNTELRELMAPHFKVTLTWDELEQRVENLVKEDLFGIPRWKRRDLVAALGISYNGEVETLSGHCRPLLSGHIVVVMVCKAMARRYDQLTDDEKNVVNSYFETQQVNNATISQLNPNPAAKPDIGFTPASEEDSSQEILRAPQLSKDTYRKDSEKINSEQDQAGGDSAVNENNLDEGVAGHSIKKFTAYGFDGRKD